jgi:ribulose 1,5-bisphosphate synthetase/thiazole synthase
MRYLMRLQLAAVCLSLVMGTRVAAETHEADVVVYGDASGGVTAAVQVARMGKSVILVSQYGHLGGMTSGGLGWTDIGNDRILGGLSREFYHRLYLHYRKPEA